MTDDEQDVAYSIPWRSSGIRTGAHRSILSGCNGAFRDLVPLMQLPDPRRIAIRASLSDPFERLLVRRGEQLSAVDICVLIDVSRSMAFKGRCRKLAIAADLASAIATSAEQVGDSFSLIPFDSEPRQDLMLHKTRSRAAHQAAIERLREFDPENAGAAGLAQSVGFISGMRKLVFVISDFLWSAEEARTAGDVLAFHDVVPIEIVDGLQFQDVPDWGLFNFRDLEISRRRLVAMRPSLKAKWKDALDRQRSDVTRAFDATARQMLTVQDRIDWTRLTAFLIYGST